MEAIKLNCVLMSNGEIMFNGRSLGFFKQEEIDKWVETEQALNQKGCNKCNTDNRFKTK